MRDHDQTRHDCVQLLLQHTNVGRLGPRSAECLNQLPAPVMRQQIYKPEDTGKHGLVVFVRSGTHSELFS